VRDNKPVFGGGAVSRKKAIFLNLGPNTFYPADMEIVHTEASIKNDENGKYLPAVVLVPVTCYPEELLSRARPASIALDWRCDPLEPIYYDRVVEDGSKLHVLDEAGNIIQTYNTNSSAFVAVWWETKKQESYEKIAAKYFSDSLDEGAV
jgi:hypothetical protein